MSSLPRHSKPQDLNIESQDIDLTTPEQGSAGDEFHDSCVIAHLRQKLQEDLELIQEKSDDRALARFGYFLRKKRDKNKKKKDKAKCRSFVGHMLSFKKKK